MSTNPVQILERKLNSSRGRPFGPIEEAIGEIYGKKSQYAEFMEVCRSFQGNFRQFEEDYDIKQIAEEPEKFEPEVEEIVKESIEAAGILIELYNLYEDKSGREEKFWEMVFEKCLDALYRDFVRIDEQIGRLGTLHPVYNDIEEKFANKREIQFAVKMSRGK